MHSPQILQNAQVFPMTDFNIITQKICSQEAFVSFLKTIIFFYVET
jgi:hypothetical protein